MNKPFDPTKPCRTRDGRKAEVLCEFTVNGIRCLFMRVTEQNGEEWVGTFASDGRYNDEQRRNDLINLPERTSLWTALYNDGCTSGWHSNREGAVARQRPYPLACILRQDYEDGEPVGLPVVEAL